MQIDIKIGAIIPAFNVADFIGEALNSLEEQLSPFDQVIIVNDGSTDETEVIVQAYVRANPSWQIINIQNQGQGVARNLGLFLLDTDYVYFFDADDLLDRNFVKSMRELLLRELQPDLVLFSGQSFSRDGFNIKTGANYLRGFSCGRAGRAVLVKSLINSGLYTASPCLYLSKRKMWANNNISFGSYYHEDERVFLKLLIAASSTCVDNTVYFYRRFRENSTMTGKVNKSHILGDIENLTTLASDYRYLKLDRPTKKLMKKRAQRYVRRVVENSITLKHGNCFRFIWLISSSIRSPILFSNALVKWLLVHFKGWAS